MKQINGRKIGSLKVVFKNNNACFNSGLQEASGKPYRCPRPIYFTCSDNGVAIHPGGAQEQQPWGKKEFSLLDPDNNLLTFPEDRIFKDRRACFDVFSN